MANTRVKSLFVLTLLQLCRAEIADDIPQWYSANVINDGFQPKSISEIFSTESPFSPTNPIVVLPKSTSMPEKVLSSTLAPPSSIFDDITKTSIIPLHSSTPLSNTISTVPPQSQADFSSRFPSQPPQVEITQFTEETQPSSESQYETLSDLRKSTPYSSVSPYTLEQQTTLAQVPSSPSGRFLSPVQNDASYISNPQPTTLSTPSPFPNYFVVYQQAPQNTQVFTEPGSSLQGGLFGIAVPQQSSTTKLPGSTVVIQNTQTQTSTASPRITLSNSFPTTLSSQRPTARIPTSNRPSSNVPTSNFPTTRFPTTRLPTSRQPTRVTTSVVSSTRAPTTQFVPPNRNCSNCSNVTQYSNIGGLPVRIRVVSPKGSITHVNINPSGPSTTTRRPTTTRTRKTPKPKKNTYDACLNGCKVRREPICAIPLSATSINPDQLKGFPSVCHMACFNSYKKEPYEKLLDGRCGRLRTRIQSFDSNTKLKRDELNKAQYVVDNGDQTIIEVAPLRRHK